MTDRSQPASAPLSHRGGTGPTVLLVEDEDPLRSAIGRLLQNEGYTVLEAQNGARALAGFTAQLMDMRLVSPHFAFLAKPFRNEELLVTIRSQLGLTS
jgi:PleD family two-component response regulator